MFLDTHIQLHMKTSLFNFSFLGGEDTHQGGIKGAALRSLTRDLSFYSFVHFIHSLTSLPSVELYR